jgi:hypothetical protein
MERERLGIRAVPVKRLDDLDPKRGGNLAEADSDPEVHRLAVDRGGHVGTVVGIYRPRTYSVLVRPDAHSPVQVSGRDSNVIDAGDFRVVHMSLRTLTLRPDDPIIVPTDWTVNMPEVGFGKCM